MNKLLPRRPTTTLLVRPALLLVTACLCWSQSAFAAAEDEVRAAFERFVQVQNAHDAKGLEALLADSPRFLWITRGTLVWGREAALQRFSKLYEGTWRLDPELGSLSVVSISADVAQLHVPVLFTVGSPGQPPQATRFLLNQLLVKSAGAWRVMTILPIPAPAP